MKIVNENNMANFRQNLLTTKNKNAMRAKTNEQKLLSKNYEHNGDHFFKNVRSKSLEMITKDDLPYTCNGTLKQPYTTNSDE